MYVTGGVGATDYGEAFSHAYDLPPDLAYAETCASVGLVFWAWRMLQYQPRSVYADVMERALYNGALSGMSLDGKSFFYVNPLECRPEDCHKDERKEHVQPVRQKWFSCACCPPNLARLISSVGQYAFTWAGERVYIHLLMDAQVSLEGNGAPVRLELSCGMPWDGGGTLRVTGLAPGARLQAALRLPEWSGAFQVGGAEYRDLDDWVKKGGRAEHGYLILEFDRDGELPFSFSMPVRFLRADRRVREAAGQVTVARGPVVYCLEEADNGPDLHLLHVDPSRPTRAVAGDVCGEPVVRVVTAGTREPADPEGELYREYVPQQFQPVELSWVPYYTWANRGENEMRVWCALP